MIYPPFEPPNRGPWHPWFAWRPIRTDWHGWRWLVHLERRMWRGGGTHGWDYRPEPGATARPATREGENHE